MFFPAISNVFGNNLFGIFDNESVQNESIYNTEEINNTNDSIDVSSTTLAFIENNGERFVDALLDYSYKPISEMSVYELMGNRHFYI